MTDKYSSSTVLFKRGAEIQQFYLTEFLKAIEGWEKVLRVDPRNTDAYANQGYCYARMGEFNRAIKSYEMSISIGNDTRAHNNLGCANWLNQNVAPPHHRDINDAKTNFTNAQKNADSGSYEEIAMNVGLVYLKSESFDDAIKTFSNILSTDSLNADALLLRGISLLGKKKFSTAYNDFQAAMELQNLPYGDK